MDSARARQALARRRAERAGRDPFCADWFTEQSAFYNETAQLSAALCSRRAGKTRGGNEADVRDASKTKHGRFLYLNETLDECRKLAWVGARGDGMASLCRKHFPDRAIVNESHLTIHFPDIDSWIYLKGADDEQAVMRALGLPYNRVRWDEAQKIPPKFTETIKETLLPSLLDYGGQLKFTGTPDRKMNGIFFEITRPELEKRLKGWSVHHWTLMQNPYWGRAKQINGAWYVVWRWDDVIVSGPHELADLDRAVRDSRHTNGVLGLQRLLGGEDDVPLDSPIMLRQGGGQWVYEDASFVYHVHKVRQDWLTYAPARMGADGFIDLEKALQDLPGWPRRDYFMALGGDLGVFGLVLWAWSQHDPVLYEVGSFKKAGLDYDAHAAYMARVRDVVNLGVITADAGGGGKQAVMGWSKKFVDRYGQPIIEATKHHKNFAIGQFNTDLERGRVRVREGGAWLEEARAFSWSSIVNSKGEKVADPTSGPCHVLDAGLYAHRESWHFRNTVDPAEERAKTSIEERRAREAKELERDMEEDDAYYH